MKRLLLLVCLLPSLCWAQSYPLFKPANGILKGATTTYVTTAAAASDVISLWSGSCSSTTFLRGDGSCESPGGAGIGTVTSVALSFTGSGISVTGSPITSAGTLALSGTLNVATGGTGATTLTGLLEGNGTSAIDPAESADVITLWTGTCNSTTFLRGDGSCQSAAGTSANPTATVGPTATNGVATTFMRSDGAPGINLTSAYTWTGPHSFTSTSTTLQNVSPFLVWNETGVTANNGVWQQYADGEQMIGRACNDALSTCNSWYVVDRSGATIDQVNLLGTTVAANGVPVLTTSSSLTATNLTGTIADARLSANVALKNVGDQTFSVTGDNSLRVVNTSTGFAQTILQTNGINRARFCTHTSASGCVVGDSANDSAIRTTQRFNISTDDGGSLNASFSNTTVNFTATNVQANASRINTVANSGKTAYGAVNGTTGALSGSLNVTSASRITVGTYQLDLAAAAFAVKPVCVASGTSTRTAGVQVSGTTPNFVVSVDTVTAQGGGVFNATDTDINVICHGL